MEIETSLNRLDEAIKDGRKLSAGSKVLLPIGEKAEIYGFIELSEDMWSSFIDMPPLGECHVLSNRVISYLNKEPRVFPIFNSVCKASENRYDLSFLYVSKFFSLYSGYKLKAYTNYIQSKQIFPDLNKLEGVKIEDTKVYYNPEENELYFESRSKFRAIGSGFAVITRRLSQPSDNIKYEIFDSHTVMIERDEKNTSM